MVAKIAHLQTIQSIISRLTSNSFLLKGWSITLISAMFALALTTKNPSVVQLALFPAVMFWVLDAYFLRQERRFRNLYDYVRQQDPDLIDFSLTFEGIDTPKYTWLRAFLSHTLLLFHGAILICVALVGIVLK